MVLSCFGYTQQLIILALSYDTFDRPSPSNRFVGDKYTEFELTDDATSYNEIEPLLPSF